MTTPAVQRPHNRAVLLIAVPLSIFFGAAVATQSRINGELGLRIGDGYAAALISFSSGLLILCIAMLFWKPGRQGARQVRAAVVSREIPWWYLGGGVAGGFFVLSQGVASGILGVALFTIAAVCGQTISGVLIDRAGLGSLAPRPVTLVRLLGSALALVAVGLAGAGEIHGNTPLWIYLMPLIAGLGIGWQQAVNGQVKRIAQSALTATFWNFVVGTTVLALGMLVHSLIVGWPQHLPSEAWLYVGGAIGVIFIAGAAIMVSITGVLLLGLGTISGQLLMSLILDVVAPVPGHTVTWTTVAGTLLALVAVVIVALSTRVSPATVTATSDSSSAEAGAQA
jgi:bacterial/archaeal transporter family-2 protein